MFFPVSWPKITEKLQISQALIENVESILEGPKVEKDPIFSSVWWHINMVFSEVIFILGESLVLD